MAVSTVLAADDECVVAVLNDDEAIRIR